MRWLVLALLLIATPVQAQTVVWFSGLETGSVTELVPVICAVAGTIDTSTGLKNGAYGIKSIQNQCFGRNLAAGTGPTTSFIRTWWKWDTIASTGNSVAAAQANGGATAIQICLDFTSKKLFWYMSASAINCNVANQVATGTTVTVTGTWYLIEAKFVSHASAGGVELKINGNTEFTSLGTNTSAVATQDWTYVGPTWGGVAATFYYDDVMVCTGAYCPHGITIARQGTSGSPTYTAWTLNSCTGGTIDGCWSETPFTATTPSASSTVLNDAQTMVVHDFATTQTGHGTETVGNTSTINACKTAMVANAASGGTLTMRRRISGSDTDTAKTITTSNAYYDDGIWTTTAGVLGNSANMQIGAKQGANTVTQTVRDMWLMCDFLNASQAPKHRAIQQ